MISRDYRTYGWWYTVIGAGLFISAFFSLFDPSATRIYVGGLIAAPILFIRGVYFLRLYYTDPDVRTPPPPLSGNPVELYGDLIRQGSPVKAVACAGCRQEYVYLPGRAAQFQAEQFGPEVALEAGAQALVADCALAPCPHCGYIQPEMFASCPSPPSVRLWVYIGIVASFIAAVGFAYAISKSLGSAPNQAEPPSVVTWAIVGLFAVLGVGSFCIGWRVQKRWDPNSESEAKRLVLGKQVSLTREEYEKLLRTVRERASGAERGAAADGGV